MPQLSKKLFKTFNFLLIIIYFFYSPLLNSQENQQQKSSTDIQAVQPEYTNKTTRMFLELLSLYYRIINLK